MGQDTIFLVFWMLSFKPTFSLSSFTFIKRLFNSSSLSAIRAVLSAYLRLLIFLPAILIPTCAFSSPAFLMMYSAYKLNKQGDSIQPWCTPFPIWIQSVVSFLVLTVASWPAYRFLKRHVRWLVQDSQIINKAVVPLHLIVPNPYTLSKILEWAKYFSVIDLKYAFYSIPLVEEGQFVFAFEDPTQPASQLTWTVLHQGFHDSLHLFEQSLSQDIQNFNSPKAVALQYINDNLLCDETGSLLTSLRRLPKLLREKGSALSIIC